MSPMNRSGAVLLALLVTGSGGCTREPEVELPPLEYHGTYVSLGFEGEYELCGGTLPWMDRHVETLGALFKRSVDGVAIDYYWLDIADVGKLCDDDVWACAHPGVVYSAGSLNEHEIVHAVLYHWVGAHKEAFFTEGVAVAAGDHIFGGTKSGEEFAQLQQMIGTDRTLEVDYPTAGVFVTYLIDTWGAPTYLEFFGTTTSKDRYATIGAKFEEVYGVTLDGVVSDFVGGRGCLLLLPGCSVEPTPWTGDRWETTMDFVCSESALGPDVSLYMGPWNYVTVDIPETGTYLLSSEGPEVPFYHCAPCSERDPPHRTNGIGEPAVEANMLAGRYVAYQYGLFGADVTLDIAIDRVVP